MKALFLLISIVLFTLIARGQNTTYEKKYVPITLRDTLEGKIVAVTVGKKAIIYFRESAIRKLAKQYRYDLLMRFLDSTLVTSDTARFSIYTSSTSDSLEMQIYPLLHPELISGNAKVYLINQKTISSNIYYSLDKGELMTLIHYYLPDKEQFYFSVYSTHSFGKISVRPKKE